MNRIAVFPGSFDPITLGHYDIVQRASSLFQKVIVAIGTNSDKKPLFTLEQRLLFLQQAFSNIDNVVVDTYEGLTVDYCKKVEAAYLLRGLRSSPDFDYEKSIAQMNQCLAPQIETVFLVCPPNLTAINSSIVRDIYRNGGNIEQFLPPGIKI
ncbi:MAG: pantetheine-phosphate adenylyltransferase [Bacteroidota bacterium]|nr:pantetheine-phosphate adenylyltransferase [Bacteroidota bacterium]